MSHSPESRYPAASRRWRAQLRRHLRYQPRREELHRGDSTPATQSITKAFELIGRVVAPATLVTALLFYFGWVRTRALYDAFGLDQTVLGFSTEDYLLRSVGIAGGWLSILLAVGLLAGWAHFAITRFRQSNIASRHPVLPVLLALAIGACGLLFTVASYAMPVLILQLQLDPALTPLAWTIGVGMTGYGLSLFVRREEKSPIAANRASRPSPLPTWLLRFSLIVLVGLILVGLFSTVAVYADGEGRRQARRLVAQPSLLPRVTVYSQNPLNLESAGIQVEQISLEPNAYQFRYTGLRFLVRAGGKYFLLSDPLASENSAALILPDTEAIRVEMAPGDEITR